MAIFVELPPLDVEQLILTNQVRFFQRLQLYGIISLNFSFGDQHLTVLSILKIGINRIVCYFEIAACDIIKR